MLGDKLNDYGLSLEGHNEVDSSLDQNKLDYSNQQCSEELNEFNVTNVSNQDVLSSTNDYYSSMYPMDNLNESQPLIHENNNDSVNGLNDVPRESSLSQLSSTVMMNDVNCRQPVEIKLFVGRLPKSMDESGLYNLFSPYGKVTEAIIIQDKITGMHKGSGFVKMESITEADKAIRNLHSKTILDNQLGPIQVKYANGEPERLGFYLDLIQPGQDVAKLFVGSFPKATTEADIKTLFSRFGHIEEVVLIKDLQTSLSKGCAFVKFQYKEDAINAIRKLHQVYFFSDCKRPLEVKFAENRKWSSRNVAQVPLQQMNPSSFSMTKKNIHSNMHMSPMPMMKSNYNNYPHTSTSGWVEYFTPNGRPYYHNDIINVTQWVKPPEFDRYPPIDHGHYAMTHSGSKIISGPLGANIFVFHIPNEWTQHDLRVQFSTFGNIVSCYIATDKTTGKNRGFGFVSYQKIESAAYAILKMDGYIVGSKRLKVSVKIGEEKYIETILEVLRSQSNNTNSRMSSVMPSYISNQNASPYRVAPY